MSFTTDELKNDLKILTQQRDQSFQQYHQLCGAVSILEQQINVLETKKNEEENKNQDQVG